MLPRQAMSIRNEEEDSSVGVWGGSDFRYLYLSSSLLRKPFFSSGSRPFEMKDAFANRFGVMQCTNYGKPHFGICVAWNHGYAFDVVNLATS
jgi:hypothetical protein